MAFNIYDSTNHGGLYHRIVAVLQDRQVRVIEGLPLYVVAMEPGADYFEHWNVLRDTLRMVLRYIQHTLYVKYIFTIKLQ